VGLHEWVIAPDACWGHDAQMSAVMTMSSEALAKVAATKLTRQLGEHVATLGVCRVCTQYYGMPRRSPCPTVERIEAELDRRRRK
jgi:hypothetical protein